VADVFARGAAEAAAMRIASILCLGALACAAPAGAQAQEPMPFVSCARYAPVPNTVTGVFGYTNATASPIDLPIGANNFFSPGTLNRGQPTTFLPGLHSGAFESSFQWSASQPQITWSLQGHSVQVTQDTVPQCAMFWRGAWQPNVTYAFFDVVSHAGGSWIAVADPGPGEPGTNPDWQALASASTGPRGAAGPPGDQLTFPSPRTWSLSDRGRRRITDAHVRPTSVIVVQYVGQPGAKPTSVSQLQPGGFVAIGSPGRHFRYVVYNQP
jgi:hypothetical protein